MFGCIADDFTGASDIGALIARQGYRVALMIGVPEAAAIPADVDAIVIALKSRTIDAALAVNQSLDAARWLKAAGAHTLYFKYCSTFDSTDQGNIGPVARALADFCGATQVLFNPAFPENGRTIFNGHLFVDGRPIHETGMANHPLTPMRDPDLVRVLARQVGGAPVGLVDHATLSKGVADTAAAIAGGPRYLIADGICDADLATLADAAKVHDLATGGSAFGAAYARTRLGAPRAAQQRFPEADAAMPVAILAGSCSETTLRQIAAVPEAVPHLTMKADALAADQALPMQLSDQAHAHLAAHTVVLISSSCKAAALAEVQARLGREAAGAMIERGFADIAQHLFAAGQRVFIVAGGETSGAVVERLGVRQLLIGPEIAPGVPWCYSEIGEGLWLALKSGNFGGEHFFMDACRVLKEEAP